MVQTSFSDEITKNKRFSILLVIAVSLILFFLVYFIIFFLVPELVVVALPLSIALIVVYTYSSYIITGVQPNKKQRMLSTDPYAAQMKE